jgi:hypothetical protein
MKIWNLTITEKFPGQCELKTLAKEILTDEYGKYTGCNAHEGGMHSSTESVARYLVQFFIPDKLGISKDKLRHYLEMDSPLAKLVEKSRLRQACLNRG